MASPDMRARTWPFTAGMILASIMVAGATASALGGVPSFGPAVFLLGVVLFFTGKLVLLWFLRSRVKQESDLPGMLADREWRLVSTLYFVSAACLLAAILLGHERFWATVGLIVALVLGWTYFVISRKHGVA